MVVAMQNSAQYQHRIFGKLVEWNRTVICNNSGEEFKPHAEREIQLKFESRLRTDRLLTFTTKTFRGYDLFDDLYFLHHGANSREKVHIHAVHNSAVSTANLPIEAEGETN